MSHVYLEYLPADSVVMSNYVMFPPRVEKLGYSLPEFDFRLPGVTSMSADIHKYGLGIKASTSGSSVAFQFHLVTSLFRSAGGECGTVPGRDSEEVSDICLCRVAWWALWVTQHGWQ